MTNFVSNGNSLQVNAPVGGVVGGEATMVGTLVGIPVTSAAEGEQYTLKLKGVYSGVKKKAAEAWSVGDKLYFNAQKELEKTAANGSFAGFAAESAQAAAVVGTVLLSN
ncbi:DUF2190 family protein [Terrimonas sp. NA20]|uniref:DUF2190 family protein n=1 Tax=Terrimonas ginsenosidimutans TaxID=2908004 RepID=A0ABS9KRE9_9BACT|nr:DUF2190 family protein [Terrimonas ginsenosidimutans]MCG2614891.1 DUF2190 family protein [Terrimonas ginsenosidimutans]